MPDFQKYHVFCDESATSERFTVIGAIVCHETVEPKLTAWLDKIVSEGPETRELKWGKVKKHNLPRYKAITTATLKACRKGYASYVAIVVDNSTMDHRLYNEGDREIGFNKMLFQLLYSLARKYRSRPKFYVHLDFRTTKHTPERLREMLNRKAARDLRVTHTPYRACHFRQSHEVRLIQAADILTGAIAFKLNQHDVVVGAAVQKVDLMKHIASEMGLRSLAYSTTFAQTEKSNVDIWHIDLTSRAKGVPRP